MVELPVFSPREKQIVRGVLSPFSQAIDVAGVFGSRATGRARPSSDIDLVLYGRLSDREINRLWTLFDESALAVTVDVVSYNAIAHPPLKRHIDAVMKPLFTQADLLAPASD